MNRSFQAVLNTNYERDAIWTLKYFVDNSVIHWILQIESQA